MVERVSSVVITLTASYLGTTDVVERHIVLPRYEEGIRSLR